MGDNMKGKIIVIEGACDGIGKTTQYQMLIDNLKNSGKIDEYILEYSK